MARRLGDNHTLIIQDNVSDSDIHLYHRMPDPKEIISYRNGNSKRVRNKIVDCTGENRLRHGKKILKGFREGDFEKRDDKGKWVKFSSDPKSKHYDPDWRKLLEAQASDLIELLAVHVFDASGQKITEDEQDEDSEDLEGNS
jgi:hypothetical protein